MNCSQTPALHQTKAARASLLMLPWLEFFTLYTYYIRNIHRGKRTILLPSLIFTQKQVKNTVKCAILALYWAYLLTFGLAHTVYSILKPAAKLPLHPSHTTTHIQIPANYGQNTPKNTLNIPYLIYFHPLPRQNATKMPGK